MACCAASVRGLSKVLWLVVAGILAAGRRLAARLARTVPGRQTHLDAELDVVQRRLVFPAAGRFLYGHRHLGMAGLGVSAGRHRHELDRGLLHRASVRRVSFIPRLRRISVPDVFQILGPAYETLLSGGCVLLVYWLILFWMYRHKLFVKI